MKNWTKQQITEFKENYLKMSNKELEELYNVSHTTIWKWAKLLDIKRDKNYYKDNLYTRLDVTKQKKAWNDSDVVELRSWASSGNGYNVICNKLGRSKDSIKTKCKYEGIKIKVRK